MDQAIKACIFDLDGVIVDTAKYHYLAWKRLAEELGFFFSEAHNERLKGVSRMTSLEILLEVGSIKHLTGHEKIELATKKNEWYRQYILQMQPDEILPGVLDFLKELKENNVKIALGSASKNAPTILKQVKIEEYFDAVIDGNQVSEAKPNPEVFVKAAAALGVNPLDSVVFEDAEAGIEAALNGNMFAIAVGPSETLNKAHLRILNFKDFSLKQLNQAFEKTLV